MMAPDDRSLISSATCLGIGLGGFVDGILFHQLLQIHNMLSNIVPKINLVNMEINMFWDGLFHAFCFVMVIIGLSLFWRAVKRGVIPLSTRMVVGSMLLGWGIFNLVEGIIDHVILQVHHVVEALGLSAFDWGFIGSGILFVFCGQSLIHSGRTQLTRGQPKQIRAS